MAGVRLMSLGTLLVASREERELRRGSDSGDRLGDPAPQTWWLEVGGRGGGDPGDLGTLETVETLLVNLGIMKPSQ